MAHTPTAEQERILREYRRQVAIGRGRVTPPGMVINAYAGSGKTTIMRMLADADPTIAFLYVAYNGSTKKEAERTFPKNARCYTSHGLAHKPMIDMSCRIAAGKYTPGAKLAKLMKITHPVRLSPDRVLSPGQFASVVKATIQRFCYSADERVEGHHVPHDLKRFGPGEIQSLVNLVPPVAQRVWDTDITTATGEVPMVHDYYLKAYALTHPRLPGHVIAVDEAQDSNPCWAQLVREQVRYGKLVILTGDTYQQLYGWRGATDAMGRFAEMPGVVVLSLTQSFRFGRAIAEEANRWLRILDAPYPLRGSDQIQSRIGNTSGPSPDAILCRTNGETFRRAIDCLSRGLTVAFPKGAGELFSLVKGARDIKAGHPSDHPDLMAFMSWGQVQDFVEKEDDGADLKLFVDLVDEYGVDELLALLEKVGNGSKGDKADVTIGTVHTAKGLEWRQVEIASDFEPSKRNPDGPSISRELAMVIYVAVTRAQWVLNPAGLLWLDEALAGEFGGGVPAGAVA